MNRGVPITVAALALVLLAGDAAAQHRPSVTWQRPNPQATRPMGVPASVQPSGRPTPAPPGCWYPCGAQGLAPGYAYAVPVLYAVPIPWYPRPAPVMTVVEPVAPAPRAAVRRFAQATATGCAVVEIRLAGERWRSPVPLPSLGADAPESLFRAIAQRLALGQQVALVSLNGTRLALPGGLSVSGLAVEPCDGATVPDHRPRSPTRPGRGSGRLDWSHGQ